MDYAEELFNAVGILLDKKIQSIKFDETITATIVDASKSDDGIYTVSTGNAKFIAYSVETVYRENDIVMVTIPQGDYNNQKVIIGKQVDNLNTPMIYRSPLQSIVDISNNLIDTQVAISYWANASDVIEGRPWNLDTSYFKNSTVYINNKYIWQEDYHSSPLVGYTRLGIKAQFSTWLSEYDTVSGNYGLALEVFFTIPDDPTKTWSKIIIFDSKDFFGDIYNFETYYTQEQLFDIEDYVDYPIVGLKLFAYQRNNFKDIGGNYIPTREDSFSSVGANIFIKDLYVCVGIPRDSFEDDIAEIYCEQGLVYTKEFDSNISAENRYNDRINRNKKNIFLRWVHKDDTSDIIKTVEYDDNFMSDYKIFWYRYKLGAKSPDEFAGAHWERYYGVANEAIDEDWALPPPENTGDSDVTDLLQILFIPNVNRQTEKIKAIILKRDNDDEDYPIYHVVAASNILEFNNSVKLSDQTTLIEMNALSIRYDDDEKGHYFLYNEAGDIGKNEDSEIRLLTAVYDEVEHNVYAKQNLQIGECSSVRWIFPDANANTMIVPMDDTTSDAVPATWDAIHSIWLNHSGTELGLNQGQVGFTIKKHLDNTATQNTIRLEIVRDGISFTAQVQPIFGTAGLNGSDYTLILTWLDGKNALDVNEPSPSLQGELTLFDQAGNVLEWPLDAEVTCDWSVMEISGTTQTKKKALEQPGMFYPVFRSANYAIMYDQNNTTKDNGYQNSYFYYFVDSNIGSSGHQDYYYFDLTEKKFKHLETENFSDPNANNYYTKLGQLYQKSTTNTVKNKLEFRAVKFTTNPLNEETGIISYNSDMVNASIHRAITVNNDTKEYYYSPEQRYFIKYEDRYIIDPWKEYQEVETYYEPIEAKEIIYTTQNDGQIIAGTLTATPDNINKRLITVTANGSINMDSLFILRITLGHFGDYDLVTFYPIPLKNNQNFNVDYIEGPDRVRYDSSGALDFNKNPYQITARQQQNNNVIVYKHGYLQMPQGVQELDGYWKLLIANQADPFRPILKETAIDTSVTPHRVKDVIEDKYDIPMLSPPSIYIPEATAYGVQFVYTPDDNSDHEMVLWTQPILVYENRYPSRTLNKWNGKDIVTDKDAGTITASGFSAGKKERDNSFTGVVIGDWSRSIADAAIAKNTGIYGFYKGAMSYAFKDDGTGFIGKDGSGRIYLDGNKSQIYSSKWANQNVPQGMLLDIDDGYLKMQSTELIYKPAHKSQSLKTKYFPVMRYGVDPHTTPLYVAGETLDTYVALTENDMYNSNTIYYEAASGGGYTEVQDTTTVQKQFKKFTYKRRSDTGEALYIKDGGGQYVELDDLSEYDSSNSTSYYEASAAGKKYITIGSNQKTYPMSIGIDTEVSKRPFRVTWDGKTYITDGEFDGHITARSGDIYGTLNVYGTLSGGNIEGATISGGTITGSYITAQYLYADNGSIGGWTIRENTLSSQNGTTVLNSNPGTGEYNFSTQSANIGGWIVDNEKLSSISGNTTLKSNPTSGEANITTEYITVRSGTASGTLGFVQGSSGSLIGMTTSSAGLVFESATNTNIRFSAINGAVANGIYIHGKLVELGKGNDPTTNTDQIILTVNGAQGKYVLYLRSDSEAPYRLYTDVPPEQQYGIYARFA